MPQPLSLHLIFGVALGPVSYARNVQHVALRLPDTRDKNKFTLTICCHAKRVTLKSTHNCGIGVHLFRTETKQDK